ncbi:tail fiber domain-containing protein [Haliscomenobacter sp.]|uniref:tail fiber domain-containing protein n=1 Tax=Haliscomenobacter sp. TaxID=2717303 RepID=UPI003BACCFF9
MSITRSALKSRFNPSNNTVPTGADYYSLISSVLNLAEDKFYGVWRSTAVYYAEAIVIHNKAFYQLNAKATIPFCSNTNPKDDQANWNEFQETAKDEDWIFSDEKTKILLYANTNVQKVGIGTTNPQASLEVAKKETGTIKLQPELPEPELTIVNEDPDCKKNNLVLRVTTSAVELETNSPEGFQIQKILPDEINQDALIISADATNTAQPRVGIGTSKAEAHLEVKLEKAGSIKVDGGENNGKPSLKIQKEEGALLKISASPEAAEVFTWSEKGLLFKGDLNDVETTFVCISPEGKLGIATENPSADLHIASEDDRDGHIKIGFNNTLPTLNLINHRATESAYNNAFALGTNMDEAILKTDSKNGFAFKTNAKTPSTEKTVGELTEGQTLMQLHPSGLLSVGVRYTGPFLLDVNGFDRNYGHYTIAEDAKIDPQNCAEIGDVTRSFCDLKPLRFKWRDKVFGDDEGKWNFGLKAEEVENLFPEVVLDNAVSYEALVPVLVKVLQEQISYIGTLEDRIKKLELGQKKQS